MSIPKVHNYAGAGVALSERSGYSQAITIPMPTGTLIKAAGQGGWENDAAHALDASDVKGQVSRAFENVEHALKAAGANGWEDVILLRTYAVAPVMDEVTPACSKELKARCSSRPPVWTALSVPKLAIDTMQIEVEVEAWVPKV